MKSLQEKANDYFKEIKKTTDNLWCEELESEPENSTDLCTLTAYEVKMLKDMISVLKNKQENMPYHAYRHYRGNAKYSEMAIQIISQANAELSKVLVSLLSLDEKADIEKYHEEIGYIKDMFLEKYMQLSTMEEIFVDYCHSDKINEYTGTENFLEFHQIISKRRMAQMRDYINWLINVKEKDKYTKLLNLLNPSLTNNQKLSFAVSDVQDNRRITIYLRLSKEFCFQNIPIVFITNTNYYELGKNFNISFTEWLPNYLDLDELHKDHIVNITNQIRNAELDFSMALSSYGSNCYLYENVGMENIDKDYLIYKYGNKYDIPYIYTFVKEDSKLFDENLNKSLKKYINMLNDFVETKSW